MVHSCLHSFPCCREKILGQKQLKGGFILAHSPRVQRVMMGSQGETAGHVCPQAGSRESCMHSADLLLLSIHIHSSIPPSQYPSSIPASHHLTTQHHPTTSASQHHPSIPPFQHIPVSQHHPSIPPSQHHPSFIPASQQRKGDTGLPPQFTQSR